MSDREAPSSAARVRRVVVRVILVVVVFAACLVAIEGVSSFVLLFREIGADEMEVVAERRHTTHDPVLGWVNVPGTRIPEMYGPGRPLSINGQGFRGTRDFAVEVPEGKVRVICSGDSFTLGFGVGDDDAWVQRLSVVEPRFETVNMGQGGYGVDQAYLWFKRDGVELEHDVHVVAFITGDFHRMRRDVFHVYPKPVLELRQGELRVANAPVPRSAYRFPWLAQNRRHFEALRTVELIRSGDPGERDGEAGPAGTARGIVLDDARLRRVTLALFDDLARIARERGTVLVAVHLPTLADHEPNGSTEKWRRVLETELGSRGIPYVDLVPDLRGLPEDQAEALFIAEGDLGVFGATGHYSVEGNHHFAELVGARLAALPEVARRLEAAGAD